MQPTNINNLDVLENGMYHVKVSLNENNPPFWAVLLVGFTTEDNKVSSYSKVVGTDIDEIEIGTTDFAGLTVSEMLYICQQRDTYES